MIQLKEYQSEEGEGVDLALLTDGLKPERELGITSDKALNPNGR